MFEGSEAEPQFQIHRVTAIADPPLLRHPVAERPFAAFTAPISTARIPPEIGVRPAEPLFITERFVPYGLRFGTRNQIAAETLQFFETAAVYQFVIVPSLRNQQSDIHNFIFFYLFFFPVRLIRRVPGT